MEIKTTTKKRLEIFTLNELKTLFEHLKNNDDNLYLCAMLAYWCELRESELRLLTFNDFNADFSTLTLTLPFDKLRRIEPKIIYVPAVIKVLLKNRFAGITDRELNIVTLTKEPVRVNFFNGQWCRVKQTLSLGKNKMFASIRISNSEHRFYARHGGNRE
jgi:integrase